jgi:hypothetical protein
MARWNGISEMEYQKRNKPYFHLQAPLEYSMRWNSSYRLGVADIESLVLQRACNVSTLKLEFVSAILSANDIRTTILHFVEGNARSTKIEWSFYKKNICIGWCAVGPIPPSSTLWGIGKVRTTAPHQRATVMGSVAHRGGRTLNFFWNYWIMRKPIFLWIPSPCKRKFVFWLQRVNVNDLLDVRTGVKKRRAVGNWESWFIIPYLKPTIYNIWSRHRSVLEALCFLVMTQNFCTHGIFYYKKYMNILLNKKGWTAKWINTLDLIKNHDCYTAWWLFSAFYIPWKNLHE